MALTLDAHQHFWQYNPVRDAWITDEMAAIRRDFLPEDLEPVLRQNGMDGCVAVQAGQSDDETRFLVQLAEAYDFIKGVVGWVDLRAENLNDQLAAWLPFEKLKGFRHVAQAEPDDFLMRADVIAGIRMLAEFGYTYDILIYPAQLKAALHLVRDAPEVSFVIDHLAKPYIANGDINRWSNYMAELARQPNVCCKVSGMVTEADWRNWKKEDFFPYLDVVFERFGPERLLFGSDWPVCLVAADYAQVKGIVEDYVSAWGTDVRDKVFGENARQFYRI